MWVVLLMKCALHAMNQQTRKQCKKYTPFYLPFPMLPVLSEATQIYGNDFTLLGPRGCFGPGIGAPDLAAAEIHPSLILALIQPNPPL